MLSLGEFLSENFIKALDKARKELLFKSFNHVVVVHHNDADGLCAGAILLDLFESLGKKPKSYCIEKVHPAIIEKIHERKGDLIVYTDLGGLVSDLIAATDRGRNLVVILDHHPARVSKGVLLIDPELFGVSGDLFISASTLTYLFARSFGVEKPRLAEVAVIGSVGDYHDRSGGILGYDRQALHDAVDMGKARIEIQKSREVYYLESFNAYAHELADILTTLGSVGYYSGDFKLGLEMCREGVSERAIARAEELRKLRDSKFKEEIQRLKDGELKKERHIQWFSVEDRFAPMGVKVIGLFCHLIKDMSFVSYDKYLAGFQYFVPEIPGLGKINWQGVKVSMRAPEYLERKVLSGEFIGLDVVLPEATSKVNGIADATHKVAAASLIEKGREAELVQEMERIIEKFLAQSPPQLS